MVIFQASRDQSSSGLMAAIAALHRLPAKVIHKAELYAVRDYEEVDRRLSAAINLAS